MALFLSITVFLRILLCSMGRSLWRMMRSAAKTDTRPSAPRRPAGARLIGNAPAIRAVLMSVLLAFLASTTWIAPAQGQVTQWLPYVDDTFVGRGPTVVGAAGSTTGVGNPTLGPATPWTDMAGNSYNINAGNVLQAKNATFRTGMLLRNAETTGNTRIIATVLGNTVNSADYWIVLRYIDTNNVMFAWFSKAGNTTMKVSIVGYLGSGFKNPWPVGKNNGTEVGATPSGTIAYNSADTYALQADIQTDPTDPTRLQVNAQITDTTTAAAPTVMPTAYCDAGATGQMLAPGRVGISSNDGTNTQQYTRIQIQNSPVITATSNASNVTLSATAAGGAYYPLSAQWYRSTTYNFTAGGGNTFGSPVTISSLTNFANVVDTSALPNTLYYYKCIVTDSAGTPNTVSTGQMAGRLYNAPSPVVVGFIGDSTYGQISNVNVQMWNLSTGGATGGTYTVTFNGSTSTAIQWNATANDIRQTLNTLGVASLVVTGSNGNFQIIGQTTAGIDKQMAVTSSLTGNTGSATVTPFLALETAPSIMSRLIQVKFGIRSSVLTASANSYGGTNQGQGGTNSNNWTSGGSTLIAAKTAFAAAGVTHVMVDLGINDGRNSVANSTATYQTNITSLVTDLVGAGYKVILNYPGVTQQASGQDYDAVAGARMVGYQSAINTIISNFAISNPGTVYLGDTRWWQYMILHPTTEILNTDLIHPNGVGARIKAEFMADAVSSVLGITPVQSAKRRMQGSWLYKPNHLIQRAA